MINSNLKGKTGERDAVKFLRELGFNAERSQQYKGNSDSADVTVPELSHIHIEVKRDQKIHLGTVAWHEAFVQAVEDSEGLKTPVVLWRRNREAWRLTYVDAYLNTLATVCRNDDIKRALINLNAVKKHSPKHDDVRHKLGITN